MISFQVYTNHTSEGNDDSNRRDTEKPAATENPPVKKASSASIFGSAKPVDTTAREREIEEKLRKEGGDRGGCYSTITILLNVTILAGWKMFH